MCGLTQSPGCLRGKLKPAHLAMDFGILLGAVLTPRSSYLCPASAHTCQELSTSMASALPSPCGPPMLPYIHVLSPLLPHDLSQTPQIHDDLLPVLRNPLRTNTLGGVSYVPTSQHCLWLSLPLATTCPQRTNCRPRGASVLLFLVGPLEMSSAASCTWLESSLALGLSRGWCSVCLSPASPLPETGTAPALTTMLGQGPSAQLMHLSPVVRDAHLGQSHPACPLHAAENPG